MYTFGWVCEVVRIPILVSLRCDDHTLRGPRLSGEESKLSHSIHCSFLLQILLEIPYDQLFRALLCVTMPCLS